MTVCEEDNVRSDEVLEEDEVDQVEEEEDAGSEEVLDDRVLDKEEGEEMEDDVPWDSEDEGVALTVTAEAETHASTTFAFFKCSTGSLGLESDRGSSGGGDDKAA